MGRCVPNEMERNDLAKCRDHVSGERGCETDSAPVSIVMPFSKWPILKDWPDKTIQMMSSVKSGAAYWLLQRLMKALFAETQDVYIGMAPDGE